LADLLTPERRSWNMSRIGGANTGPERRLRSLLHGLGYRFRLHDRTLPGRPDVVLKRYLTAIFVHGCYWHRHRGCSKATTPSTNREMWLAKFSENTRRDRRNISGLRRAGWNVCVVWECELDAGPSVQRLLDKLASLRAGKRRR
jgi:DNA mismatch endonuclease (patch repair protein)